MNTLKQVIAGVLLAIVAICIAVTVIWLITGCSFDPVSGPDRKHDVRPDPYGVSNLPPASALPLGPAPIAAFRAAPAPLHPVLVPAPVASLLVPAGLLPVRNISAAGWEFVSAPGPLNEVPTLLLPSTPPRLKFQATNGVYRLLVSNGTNQLTEHSFTVVLGREGWKDISIELPMPTNTHVRVVSP